ncbi:MAG: hypothetical protein NZT61_02880 [Deltaproteobacteria bacterium]|nr:hypothetical protein [Deltaproteobacteria bacterium]MCX7952389.1 hypothetical protein [Deltaproteobacteria bacterium]
MFEERLKKNDIQIANLCENKEKAKQLLEKLDQKNAGGELHLIDQAKIAVKDFLSLKAFRIETFADLSLALANVHEIISHPLLTDELREYGASVLASMIENLIRQEGAMKGLDFVSKNFDRLPLGVVREIIPELTNPFLICANDALQKLTKTFLEELEKLFQEFVEGEPAYLKDQIRSKLKKYHLDLIEQNSRIELRKIVKRQKREQKLMFVILLAVLLILFWILY